jgi:asparagine synthase (glutamine-hydrolysing)
MRPDALRLVAKVTARHFGSQPLDWAGSLNWHLRQRVIAAHKHNLGLIAADYTTLHIDPFLDVNFVAALARCGGKFGFATRQEAMNSVGGDLLPPSLLARSTKAVFNAAYFTTIAREFVRNWAGRGVDDEIVDVRLLKAEWLKAYPPAPSSALLQAAWLASERLSEPGTNEAPAGQGTSGGSA